jgi:prepilin-type N-terminal cleavage/methylation domain-containing protein
MMRNEQGFSLVEALISTVIIGVAFTGVYSLTVYSEKLMRESMAREWLQMQANQILDVIDADSDNIASYVTDLTDCVDPGDGATTAQDRIYEWCLRLEDQTGEATVNDTRSITTGTNADGSTVVYVELTTQDGNVQVVMNRSFGR